ncbi:ArsR/SmtB family transcription factor [Micromonospora sp. CPCC 206061]|uniref:ArsR/SmtB family transcription factor n=1 Tax=Micromonospora sp. CPCC 206061 TaxID=3122410 RepID=UPI002FEEE6B3
MPISVLIPEDATEITFAASPLVELAWAWHVLVESDHHPDRAGWVAAVKKALPADLMAALRAWSFTVCAIRPVWLADPTFAGTRCRDDWLAGLDQLAPARFAELTLRPLLRVRGRSRRIADQRVHAEIVALARARGSAATRVVQTVLDNPEKARGALIGVLRRFWSLCFRDEWERSAPALHAEIRARTRRGPWPIALRDVSPAIRVEPGGRVTIDKFQNKTLTVAGRGIVLVPTHFGSPHVYVADEADRPVVVHYPFPVPQRAADRRLTLRRLGALAHPARLEICRAIAVEPRSAREIARLWRFTESAVTKHLSVLRDAELVRAQRVGHFVRYSLDEAAIQVLGADLLDALRR